ncbi:MAG: alpha/beta hydrolase [bacterium]|nr:alpha/beta hydrolase [bacterium]
MNSQQAVTRPELVLLPGLDGTGIFFEPFIKALEGRLTTRTVSYPMDQPLGYSELLPYVTSCFPKEKPFIIVGESFSGPLAAMAGAQRPENLMGIVLVATFVKSPMPPWVNRLKRFLRGPLLDLRPRKLIITLGLGRDCPAEVKKWVHEKLPRLERKVLAARLKAVLEVNVREELKRTDVPVLYIAATRDRLVSRKCLDVVWICRPDVQVKIIDGPHPILQCRPEDSAAAIIEFCSGILGSASVFVKPLA